MDPLHPLLPVSPGIPPIAPAPRSGRVDRDPRRRREERPPRREDEDARRDVHDGISLVQTAEGSLNEVHAMLQRIRELAVQYQNGTLATSDQGAIQSEVNQLVSEIDRIGTTAAFNGIALFSGSSTTISFQ